MTGINLYGCNVISIIENIKGWLKIEKTIPRNIRLIDFEILPFFVNKIMIVGMNRIRINPSNLNEFPNSFILEINLLKLKPTSLSPNVTWVILFVKNAIKTTKIMILYVTHKIIFLDFFNSLVNMANKFIGNNVSTNGFVNIPKMNAIWEPTGFLKIRYRDKK